ncbi:protein RICE SALT SENSITIVE 3-like isoform X6 [Prosopis cineraria]|uniref:protein RICE SALT SENSITIVE 3-like isoform X6 n=1 Tax=Prosopis cineraria TaxID=364024 RepID=UPI00240F8797|nr:protein RICE SALT SENSITIVE 3-like isoform X6 [Prosopis cineraria]
MQSSGGSCLETTLHPSGIGKVKGLMTDQEETEGTGYWRGKMVSAILQPHHLFIMGITIKGCNLSCSSRCHMRSIVMEKDHSHKWIYSKPIKDQEINLVSASADSYPRTWEAQFQCGIKTIALISVREGVMQLGSVQKVIEDPSHVVQLRRKLSYIESIPGVLLPHPSSSSSFSCALGYGVSEQKWLQPDELSYDPYLKVSPSMSSLEALLSKLPSVVPSPPPPLPPLPQSEALFLSSQRSVELMGLQRGVKEDVEDEYKPQVIEVGETSSSMHKRNVIS